MDSKPKFSFAIIAKNEEKTLPRLIESLREFKKRGGDILIVDTGSTDNTADLAWKLGCRTIEIKDRFTLRFTPSLVKSLNNRFVVGEEAPVAAKGDQIFNYAEARNYATKCALTDWTCIVDADEYFTALDIDAVNAAIESGVYTQLDAPYVYAHDQFSKPTIKFTRSRFFNRQQLQWIGVVHETLTGKVISKTFDEKQVLVEHRQNPKTDRTSYLKGLAYACHCDSTNDRNSHYFGRELLGTGRPQSAIRELQRHIAMNGWAQERAQSMVLIGDALIQLGKVEEGLQSYHRSFLTDGTRREPLMRLATYFWRAGVHQKAMAYANAALTVPWTPFYCNNVAEYEYLPHEILYWGYWWTGDKEKSRDHWEKALSYQPENPKYKNDAQFYH